MATPEIDSQLHRVLGTWDLVLLNIAAIVGLRWLSTAAQIGPSSLVLWAMGFLFFFVPLALAVLDLSARVPGEGGLYLWTKAGFGDAHGFIAGWSYWISNLVYFPSVLLFSAGVFLHIGGAGWLAHSSDVTYNAAYCLIVLWAATGLNILGLERAKWLQNIGGIAIWLVAALVVAAGALAGFTFGAATPFTAANVWPDFGKLSTFATFAIIAGAYTGLELGPIMGGEIRDPTRQIRRSVLISGVIVAAIYMAGTASLIVALPAATVDAISGIPQALSAIGDRIGMPFFGPLTAALLAMGTIGGFSAYLTGTARLPFVVGVDRYLPTAMARLHPRHGTPHVALVTQSVLATLVLLAALSGSTVHEAFMVLIDMTIILTLLPLLYILAAFPVLRERAARGQSGEPQTTGRRVFCWLASLAGLGTTLLALITSMVPPDGTPHPALFVLKVVGGSVVLLGVGQMFFWRGRHHAGDQSAA